MKALAEGQCVKHFQYGLGYVMASDAERTTIDFDDHGEKLFVTGLMTVELSGDAPVNPRAARRRKKSAAARIKAAAARS